MSKYIDANIIVHRWDQFSDRDPYIYRSQQSKRTFHLIKDDLAIYHHVILHRNQMDQLEAFYKDKSNKGIQLVQQDWSSYICKARGKKKLIVVNERKSIRSNSVESSEIIQIFRTLGEQKKEQEQLQAQVIVEERLSDQVSQRSREIEKRLKIDSNVLSHVWSQGLHKEEQLKDIKMIEEVIDLAKTMGEDKYDLILPKEIFPNGLVKFTQEFGVNNYLKLFLKLNFEHLQSSLRLTQDYVISRRGEFNKAKQLIMRELEFMKAESNEQISNVTKECLGYINVAYYDSDIVVYVPYKNPTNTRVMELRILGENDIERYFRITKDSQEEMKIILKHLNKLIQTHGLLRLPFDEKMICPLCAKIWDKLEIFKHSCISSVDLAIRRGLQK